MRRFTVFGGSCAARGTIASGRGAAASRGRRPNRLLGFCSLHGAVPIRVLCIAVCMIASAEWAVAAVRAGERGLERGPLDLSLSQAFAASGRASERSLRVSMTKYDDIAASSGRPVNLDTEACNLKLDNVICPAKFLFHRPRAHSAFILALLPRPENVTLQGRQLSLVLSSAFAELVATHTSSMTVEVLPPFASDFGDLSKSFGFLDSVPLEPFTFDEMAMLDAGTFDFPGLAAAGSPAAVVPDLTGCWPAEAAMDGAAAPAGGSPAPDFVSLADLHAAQLPGAAGASPASSGSQTSCYAPSCDGASR